MFFVVNFTEGGFPNMKDTTCNFKTRELPDTINIHLTRNCNFACRFCYAEFAECGSAFIPPERLRRLLTAIASAPPLQTGRKRKVNFAGGEPLLYNGLPDILDFSKQLDLRTSIVTNGSLLNERNLARFSASLDICAVSMDSGLSQTNEAIGRCGKGFRPDREFYQRLTEQIRASGIRLKINTVVNRVNFDENLGELVSALLPFRWKLFQVKEVIGQNDKTYSKFAISVPEFMDFVERNRRFLPASIAAVPETSGDMTGSYAMIAPNGCFFDSALGRHQYSRPILEAGIVEAFQDVTFDDQKFLKRGGLYE
jgi:radical S-adenosyl methionine domain-containing protein 2